MRKVRIGIAAIVCCLTMAITCLAEYDSSTIQQVQQALNDAGFDCGTPDGIAGKGTAAAVSAYQEANGLAADGQINDELLVSLGLKESEAETDNESVATAEVVEEAAEEPAQTTDEVTAEEAAKEPAQTTDEVTAEEAAKEPAEAADEDADRIDYLVLVNGENALPDGWEDALTLGTTTDIEGNEVQVEAEALEQFLKMQKWLLEEKDWNIQIIGAYSSVEDLQHLYEGFVELFDEEYAKEHTETPGYSEYSTGLAIDIGFIIGDEKVSDKGFLLTTNRYKKVFAALADYGFIVRYPEGKEDITGHSFEPWHIRYVGSPEVAHEITDQGITLEEYLAK